MLIEEGPQVLRRLASHDSPLAQAVIVLLDACDSGLVPRRWMGGGEGGEVVEEFLVRLLFVARNVLDQELELRGVGREDGRLAREVIVFDEIVRIHGRTPRVWSRRS